LLETCGKILRSADMAIRVIFVYPSSILRMVLCKMLSTCCCLRGSSPMNSDRYPRVWTAAKRWNKLVYSVAFVFITYKKPSQRFSGISTRPIIARHKLAFFIRLSSSLPSSLSKASLIWPRSSSEARNQQFISLDCFLVCQSRIVFLKTMLAI
jgi:hypothetical protein